ncbi:MAG: bifunctional pantoate--beta-alanine ligase/(d)CMP kinase [Synechococcales cyanobacterium]
MRLFNTIAALTCYLELYRSGNQDLIDPVTNPTSVPMDGGVGLVPTMGALHQGHLSLIRQARRDNRVVVVSIFVNPLQFSVNEDRDRYPHPMEGDRQLCQQAGVDIIFAPSPKELGIQDAPSESCDITMVIPPQGLTLGLCGRTRPNHFPGVATIVTKLFQIIQPDRAYFGRKDAQQLAIIQRLVMDLNLPVEVIPCPTIREADGLALSSRNQYLTATERPMASALYQSLNAAEELFKRGERSTQVLVNQVKSQLEEKPFIQLEYVELVDPDQLKPIKTIQNRGLLAIAAHLGSTRLIDNLLLQTHQPIIAIDGPAGAGKSTVTRRVAKALNLLHLDTGAMYRAVTWWVMQSQVEMTDQPTIAELIHHCEIKFHPSLNQPEGEGEMRIWINDHDVTQAIRSREVTANVSTIASQPSVRRALVKQQRRFGEQGGLVAEGRDMGTHVFPDAELKIFLTASVAERARRRQADLLSRGQPIQHLSELEHSIAERDRQDSTRRVSPLRLAEGGIEFITDDYTIDQVVEKIVNLYRQL